MSEYDGRILILPLVLVLGSLSLHTAFEPEVARVLRLLYLKLSTMTPYTLVVLLLTFCVLLRVYWAQLLSIYLRLIYKSTDSDYFKLSGVRAPQPVPTDFDIDTAKPRPYRPFRWRYFQNLALKSMEPDWWIELESSYRERIAQRVQLYAMHGKGVVDSLPESEKACQELMQMVIQFLCARYPKYFQFSSRTGVFHNAILDTCAHVGKIQPLLFLLEHVPEDFLLTQEDKATGLYVLRAAVSCSQIGWDLREKIGKPLHMIHGPVPDYKERMQMSMDRFFSRLPCDKPIQRGSWSLEIGQPLYAPPNSAEFKERERQRPHLDIEDVHMRVDWQTLRRLPQSRAIVFNFKALFTPITQFRHEPYIPKLLLRILKDGDDGILRYKGTSHVAHIVTPALEVWTKEQEDRGWVPKDWEERTLQEDPFYPGWQTAM